MILEIGVLHSLPKCASNGVMCFVFCFEILSRCIIACRDCCKLYFYSVVFSCMIIDV